MSAASLSIGKCKIEVNVRGCIQCGTENSHAWRTVQQVLIKIRNRDFLVSVSICGHCDNVPESPCKLTGRAKNNSPEAA